MTKEDTQFTVGKTTFYQGEHGTHPLFRIEPGIPAAMPASNPQS